MVNPDLTHGFPQFTRCPRPAIKPPASLLTSSQPRSAKTRFRSRWGTEADVKTFVLCSRLQASGVTETMAGLKNSVPPAAMERKTGFEPATLTSARCLSSSTPYGRVLLAGITSSERPPNPSGFNPVVERSTTADLVPRPCVVTTRAKRPPASHRDCESSGDRRRSP
jgi:hypothetical protein